MIRKAFYVLVVLCYIGCSNDNGPEDEFIDSSPYFPLEIGKYIDYSVLEFTYLNGGQVIDSAKYELREETVSIRTNDQGESEYIIDRSTRAPGALTWNYKNSWRALFSNNQALKIEDNLTFAKLQLPITEGEIWNGNAYFDASAFIEVGGEQIDYFKAWNSKYVSKGESTIVGNQTYDDVITISLADSENRIELRIASEQYASGIGLISREINVLDTQCFDGCANIPWSKKAEKGHIFTQYIIGHN